MSFWIDCCLCYTLDMTIGTVSITRIELDETHIDPLSSFCTFNRCWESCANHKQPVKWSHYSIFLHYHFAVNELIEVACTQNYASFSPRQATELVLSLAKCLQPHKNYQKHMFIILCIWKCVCYTFIIYALCNTVLQ